MRWLAAGEDGAESGLGQNFGDLRAFVSLNFNLAILYCATRAAGLLHRFDQVLLFRLANANEVFNHGHRLAAAPGLLPDDINPATSLPGRFGFGSGPCIWPGRQTFAGQSVKRIMAKTLPVIGGCVFGTTHAFAAKVICVPDCRKVNPPLAFGAAGDALIKIHPAALWLQSMRPGRQPHFKSDLRFRNRDSVERVAMSRRR